MSSQKKTTLYATLSTESPVSILAFNPTGTLLATGREDNQVAIYQTANWKIIKRLHLEDRVQSLAWSNDGSFLVVGGFDIVSSVWNTETWIKISDFPKIKGVESISWNKKQQVLAFGFYTHYDTDLYLINTNDWSYKTRSLGYTPHQVAFNTSNKYLAISKSNEGIDIFSTSDYQQEIFLDFSDFISKENASISKPSWSSDGKYLVVSKGDGRVRIWSTKDWEVITTIELFDYWDEAKYSCQFSSDNSFLLCGGLGVPKLIDTTWKIYQELGKDQTDNYLSISWHPDSLLFALAGRPPTKIELWKMQK